MPTLTAKSSTIFIATGDETRVYRSVSDIPPALRRKLAETTHGLNSATILIADKRGREELVRALQGQPSDVHCRLVDSIRARHAQPSEQEQPPTSRPWIWYWLELLLPVAVSASLWLLVSLGVF